jgi:hypothetical protein
VSPGTTYAVHNSSSTRSSSTSDSHMMNTEPNHEEGIDLKPQQYTSQLWDYAAKRHSAPEVEYRPISVSPPRWACTVTLEGMSEAAEDKTAKMAKHKASRQMYFRLNLGSGP